MALSISLFFFSCDNAKEISFELTDYNRIAVNAKINGKSGKLYWDTGAAVSLFDGDFRNLEFSRTEMMSFYFENPEAVDYHYLPEIIIDGVRLKGVSEIVRTTANLRSRTLEPEGLDGVLGINVFAGYWCELSFSKKKIILHKKKPARFEKFVPVILEGNYFCIPVDIDEKQSPFIVDTGAQGMYFPSSLIVGNTENEKILLPRGILHLVRTNKISIFDEIFENKAVVTNSIWNMSGPRGLVGVEFLKNYDLLFDFTTLPSSASGLYYKRINTERDEKKLFLEKAQVERILESGIYSFYRTPEGIALGIIEGSVLNAEYGITERTIIAKIDGKLAREISDRDMWNMDIFRVKNFIVLEGGEERTMEFKLGNR
ncbi:MAG: hypothetical protein LBF60_04115 [Treponema sp.]|jgi:hypothetical protein|nr:hypothetical protein [Treponema sp.]